MLKSRVLAKGKFRMAQSRYEHAKCAQALDPKDLKMWAGERTAAGFIQADPRYLGVGITFAVDFNVGTGGRETDGVNRPYQVPSFQKCLLNATFQCASVPHPGSCLCRALDALS